MVGMATPLDAWRAGIWVIERQSKPSALSTDPVKSQRTTTVELINRHTYIYGILEGIGVCIGGTCKAGPNSGHNARAQPKRR